MQIKRVYFISDEIKLQIYKENVDKINKSTKNINFHIISNEEFENCDYFILHEKFIQSF